MTENASDYEYRPVLEDLQKLCQDIFQEQLCGIYLHGSMACGCFNPQNGDIDLIVAIDGEFDDKAKLEFMNRLVEINEKAPAKGIELSVVQQSSCRDFRHPCPFDLHYSNKHKNLWKEDPQAYIQTLQGEDPDLAAHYAMIKNRGQTLYGIDSDQMFAQVPDQDYFSSIYSDVKDCDSMVLIDPVSTILNLCRSIAFAKDKLYLSKKEGGEWALENLGPIYKRIISSMLEAYQQGSYNLAKSDFWMLKATAGGLLIELNQAARQAGYAF